VHRLDRDTSGCLLLSRNPKAHARLQQAFEQGLVRKRYLAVLEGVVEGESGLIDLALAKVSTEETGWRMVGDPLGAKGSKASRTAWRVLSIKDGRSFVEFIPETGRTHQIRVHAAEALGAAVVGDPIYGNGTKAAGAATLLHAAELMVPRAGKEPIIAKAPLPERFIAAGFTEADAAPAQ
jgi:tRNA pseudouridine32 synthase/23S rRNA pseudouridine746 synthase